MARHKRAQVLVLFAVIIPVVVLLFLFALGVAALLDARAHATYALGVATRAGSRQVAYGSYGEGNLRFAESVPSRVREVFAQALALRTTGLGDTPENIAAGTVVAVGHGTPGAAWTSPVGDHRQHIYPTVAAEVRIPVRVWLFEVQVPIVSETEVR
jgi:hypothetical protein